MSLQRPNMKSYKYKVMVIFLISAVHILSLDADSEICTPVVAVRRSTVYEVLLGEEVRVECPVKFCSHPPPTVSWIKLEGNHVRINVSGNDRIKTEWKTLKQQYGVSYLIIQKALRSDSGTYRCEAEKSMSHHIGIRVEGTSEPTTTSLKQWTTAASPSTLDGFWYVMYRVFGVVAFFLLVTAICVTSTIRHKGKSRNSPELCLQPSNRIYENEL